jgi:hypothetical protein
MATRKDILKLTPLHCVVKISGGQGSETISLASDLIWSNSQQTEVLSFPVVNICGVWWSVPGNSNATIVRNSVSIYELVGSFHFDFRGFADTVENGSDIVVTLPAAGNHVVILELLKIDGYNNTQHLNSEI